MTLRDYQVELKGEIYGAWERDGVRNVLAVLPTGGGKTRTMAHIAAELDEPGLAQAHREELVGQISLAFAQVGVHHRIIAPDAVVNQVVRSHVDEVGRVYVRADARYAIASAQTIARREDPFFDTALHWQTDEGHHLLEENLWGRAVGKLINARRGIGWTATPCRTDRRSLRRGDGGCFDALVKGPNMRPLIDRGYLKDFRIYGMPQRIDISTVRMAKNGEFNQADLADAAHKSAITGDIVTHALRLAPGKKGVTFAVDVAMAEEHAAAFREAGVPTAVIHSETRNRAEIIRAYKGDGIQEIVNVDVLGEGFDCPGIVRASFARHTMSYGLFVQQFGRALRPLAGEPFGIILDHVGNVLRHGLPDKGRAWSLEGVPPKALSEVPTRVCGNVDCLLAFEAWSVKCPHCGWKPFKGDNAGRERPEMLEGDLTLYDDGVLAELRAAVDRIAGAPDIPYGASQMVTKSVEKKWRERAETQEQLAQAIDRWAGRWRMDGEPLDGVYRRFYLTFGMDTLAALSQSGPKQKAMLELVRGNM
jgi:superfamily II DNA or RNA helicase